MNEHKIGDIFLYSYTASRGRVHKLGMVAKVMNYDTSSTMYKVIWANHEHLQTIFSYSDIQDYKDALDIYMGKVN
jgi:hypothetical protein